MKGCFKILGFHIWILQIVVKYIYKVSPLKQHHKIEKRNIDSTSI
jgi:hypothetical protein